MNDFQKFAYWLQFYRPDVKLLSWQRRLVTQILNQPESAGRSFLIKLLADFDAHLQEINKGMQRDFPQLGDGECT